MVKRLTRLAAFVVGFALIAATGQATNQTLTFQDLVDNVNGGTFLWSGAAQSGNARVVTNADFTSSIRNSGACTGSTTYVMTYQDMLNCRVLTTTIGNTIDPYLTASTSYWTVYNATPSFFADTSAPGSPAGAQAIQTGGLKQALNNGGAIIAGSHITVQAYLTATQVTRSTISNDCSTPVSTTVTGSASVSILNPSGAIVASASSGVNGYTAFSVGVTAATTGTYSVAVLAQTQKATVANYITDRFGACVQGTAITISGVGRATGITASN